MKQAPYEAPQFTLTNDKGEDVSLADYAGKWVVLYFYPKDDTPGCTTQACSLRDARDDLTELGASVIGVSKDDAPSHEKFKTKYNLNFTFLVTPETSEERIKYLDSLSSGFLYAVSSSSTTGNENKEVKNDEYLNKLASINLKNPVMIGFGIKNKTDFEQVTEKAQGGIIGTAFVKILLENKDWREKAEAFIKSIK